MGFILWLLYSLILYAFFQLLREAFRLTPFPLEPGWFLVLTEEERYLYNVFFAAIAVGAGYLMAMGYILRSFRFARDRKKRRQARRTLNVQGFFTWSFHVWFGEMGLVLGLWYFTFPLQYDFIIHEELPWTLALLPLVVFFALWPDLSRFVKRIKGLYISVATLIFFSLSFGLAFVNFMDYKRIDKIVQEAFVEYAYDLELPVSSYSERLYKLSLVENIYVVRDTQHVNEPVIFSGDIEQRESIASLNDAVIKSLNNLWDVEKPYFTVNLFIDRRLPMGEVKPVLAALRNAGVAKVQFSTGRKGGKYPTHFPGYRYSGIPLSLIGASDPSSEEQISNADSVEVVIANDALIWNGEKVSRAELEDNVKSLTAGAKGQKMIVVHVENKVSYEACIAVLDDLLMSG
ncbi:MAG: biopolymer transporter ExbD, partial [Flavobacteriales bacterium]|nr:biopolymer transporter ExbD [Flavobacteriales bacterium]